MSKHKKQPIPDDCKSCIYFYNGGSIAPYNHNWCSKFSKTCNKTISHCRLTNGKKEKEKASQSSS